MMCHLMIHVSPQGCVCVCVWGVGGWVSSQGRGGKRQPGGKLLMARHSSGAACMHACMHMRAAARPAGRPRQRREYLDKHDQEKNNNNKAPAPVTRLAGRASAYANAIISDTHQRPHARELAGVGSRQSKQACVTRPGRLLRVHAAACCGMAGRAPGGGMSTGLHIQQQAAAASAPPAGPPNPGCPAGPEPQHQHPQTRIATLKTTLIP